MVQVPSARTVSPTTANRFRVHVGTSLQKHRLKQGLTQAQLAEAAGLSLKYVGEIERGEANTTLDVVARLADVLGWNPIEALDGVREPLTEGVRVMLVSEAEQVRDRLGSMVGWLRAIDPLHTGRPSLNPPVLPRRQAKPRGRRRKPDRQSPQD